MKTKCRTCCRNCVHYDSFFGSCNLYYEEVYIGEGEYDIRPVRVERISEAECEFDVENEYNTKDIRHINENNQKYIAEGNRMIKKLKENKCI